MDFVGEAISIVEGVFTGDTVPAQLVEMGIDVIKEIPEIAEAIPDIDWVLNNFVDTGGICHNIKEIVDNSIIDDVVNVVEDVGGAIGGAIGGLFGRRKRDDTTNAHPLRSLMTGITRGGINFNQAISDCCNGIGRKKRSAQWDCQNPEGFVGNILESGAGLINAAGDVLSNFFGRKKRSTDDKKDEITRKLEKQFLSKAEMKYRHNTYGKYNKTLLEMRMEAKMVGALLNNKKFTKLLNLPEKSKTGGIGRSAFATMVCRMARKVEGCVNLTNCVIKEAALVAIHGVAQNWKCQIGMLMPGAECLEEGENFTPNPNMISSPWDPVLDTVHEYACESDYSSDDRISPPVSAMQTGEPNPSLKYMDDLV